VQEVPTNLFKLVGGVREGSLLRRAADAVEKFMVVSNRRAIGEQ